MACTQIATQSASQLKTLFIQVGGQAYDSRPVHIYVDHTIPLTRTTGLGSFRSEGGEFLHPGHRKEFKHTPGLGRCSIPDHPGWTSKAEMPHHCEPHDFDPDGNFIFVHKCNAPWLLAAKGDEQQNRKFKKYICGKKDTKPLFKYMYS